MIFLRLVIFALMISCALSCQSAVKATNEEESRDLHKEIREKSIELKKPAFNTREVYKQSGKYGVYIKPSVNLEWRNVEFFVALHSANNNGNNLKIIGKKNELLLFKLIDKQNLKKGKVDLSTYGSPLLELGEYFSEVCKVRFVFNMQFESLITMHTPVMSYGDVCKTLAWVYAAHGIAFEIDKENPDTLILRDADTSS